MSYAGPTQVFSLVDNIDYSMKPIGHKWNPAHITRITGHPIIDSELHRPFDALKSFIHRKLRQWKWLEADFEKVRQVTTVRVNFDNIVSAVCESQFNIQKVIHKEARYIIVGRDHFHKIMQVGQMDQYRFMLNIEFPPDFRSQVREGVTDYLGRQRTIDHPYVFRGMRIICVPWIDGMFLLPELEK